MIRFLAILACVLALVGCQSGDARACDFGGGFGAVGFGGYGVQSFGAVGYGAPVAFAPQPVLILRDRPSLLEIVLGRRGFRALDRRDFRDFGRRDFRVPPRGRR